MAALCAATTHAPLMASVMLLELTDDSSLIVPLLLAALLASIVSRFVSRDSLYTEELRRKNVSWHRVTAPPEPPASQEVEGGAGI
jgi:CIC family chloride channel protein